MKMVSAAALAAVLALGVPGGAIAAPQTAPAGTTTPAPGSADARLKALYDAEWNWRQTEMARGADGDSFNEPSDKLPHVDAATQSRHLAYWNNVLAELAKIPRDQLSPEERVNADVFEAIIVAFVNDIRFRTYEAPFNSDTFFWTGFSPREGFQSERDYEIYLGRLKDVPRYFAEQTDNMRAGIKRGFTVPKVSVTGRDKTIEPYTKADDSNPLFLPFEQMPTNMPAARQEELRAQARAVINGEAVPAYIGLLGFIRDEYLPKATDKISASVLPNGPAYYQAMIEKFTTLKLTAPEIHQIGLGEVARIKADMEATKQQAGFDGTLAEFQHFLKTDPQFYAKTPHELLADASYWVKKADLKLKDTVGFLPRFRHGILPVPPALAPIYTGGRGGLESCLFNTYDLPARPLYTLPSLALHECTPGHSFQGALALEGPPRPAFRNANYFSGYGEGWGLYTEWLGTVMGIYETPYQEFGRETYEMWRAVRLVVDTGIHHYGWSREKALAYMRENLALSEHEITTEVDRYIAWPGQAVSYKLGELQIRRLRKEAETALGAKFDQRKFHDAILALGSVPLPVLERRLKQFIADGGENPPRPMS